MSSYQIPSQDLLIQILGKDATAESYLRGGFVVACGIKESLAAIGRNFSEFRSILDFGCGSGRVLRWFEGRKDASLRGVDISEEAIDWCKENLVFAEFVKCNPMPPLPYKDEQFDLIYGISVLTHLDETFQFAWLEELNRILRPGGILMSTIHGDNKARMDLSPSEKAIYQDLGFLYKRVSMNGGVDNGPDFYQVAYHSKKYVEQVWSRYFKILGYIGHGAMHVQDLIVMEKTNEVGQPPSDILVVDLPIAMLEQPLMGSTVHDSLTVSGWAFHPDGDKVILNIAIDGVRCGSCEPDIPRDKLAQIFWVYPHAATAGFKTVISAAQLSKGKHKLELFARSDLIPTKSTYFYKD